MDVSVSPSGSILSSNRIDRLEKGKPVEVRVSGVDRLDTVLFHEDRRSGIVHDVALQVREFGNDFGRHSLVAFRRTENADPRGGEHCCDKAPRTRDVPWRAEDARMANDAEELEEYSPRRVPSRDLAAPALDGPTARVVKARVLVRRVHKDVGIHDEQLATFHGLVEGVAVRDIDQMSAAAEGR